MQAMLPNIVSKELFPRAAALGSSALKSAVIVGPALGGLLYTFGPELVYLLAGILMLFNSILVLFFAVSQEASNREPVNLKSLSAGIAFIWNKPIVLGAISLDLFAVLFGGATAMLPVYAAEILHIGPTGLGFLRSAPAVGALCTSLYLAHRPLKSRIGRRMFTAVTIFGIATVVFSLSTNFLLSLAALVVLGASDVISVVVRHTLVQMQTPDSMRGRVSSVNSLFIGTSNQLGEFESGTTAALFGVVPAVAIGGICTIIVVLLWTRLFPKLLNIERFEDATEKA
jgi:predicted MFS family arabinose efflux permease